MNGTTRLSTVPIDHIVAELAAFPLASEDALRLNVTSLDPSLEKPTDSLWMSAESSVFGSLPGSSLDEAVALRDRIWFRRGAARMHEYVRDIAKLFLTVRGGIAIPRLPRDESAIGRIEKAREPRSRQAWRWLSFAIPTDMLLSSLYGRHGGPRRIALLSPMLSMQLRENGFAESHLHYGAAFDFPTLWVAALRSIGESYTTRKAFACPGAELRSGKLLAPWFIRAATIRYIVAAWLAWGWHSKTLAEFLDSGMSDDVLRELGPTGLQRILTGFSELQRGRLFDTDDPDIDFVEWQETYRLITGAFRRPFPKALSQIQSADPIAKLFAENSGAGPTPESRFQTRAMEFLHSENDPLFEKIYWQLTRIRCLLYRHIVQRPMTPGLQWFIRFYGRSSPAKRPFSHGMLIQSAADSCGIGRGLKALEVRTSPESTQTRMLDLVSQVHTTAGEIQNKHEECEFGLVLHFTKDRGGGAREGVPTANLKGANADPDLEANGGYRFAHHYQSQWQKASALASVLKRFPLTMQTLRGIDVCADELGVPTWVLVPLMKLVRDAANVGCQLLQSGGITIPPLRTTAHAGEDFVHLLTGIRFVDEAIERFQMREGDRIGHGLSLGIEPSTWATRTNRIAMTQEQRLFDIVWQWKTMGLINDHVASQNQLPLVQQISEISAEIFGSELTPFQLVQLTDDLHDPDMLRKIGFPMGFYPADPRNSLHHLEQERKASEMTRLERLYVYLTSTRVFHEGQRTIWVDPKPEAALLVSLQKFLREKLGARGIAVEINPTSNLLVGDLGDLGQHPLWRLNSPLPGNDAPPVAVCVGSDDPIVFNSRLREEYQLLSDAMALAELSDEQARRWLEKAAECSLDFRFSIKGLKRRDFLDPAFINDFGDEQPIDFLA